MSAPKKAVAMCCVTIGYQEFLLPADKGMRLVEIMQHAFGAQRHYDREMSYVVGDQPEVELALVKPHQIKPKPARQAGPKLLGGDD